jgi:hypothetical protein
LTETLTNLFDDMKHILIVLLFNCLPLSVMLAQEALPASGNNSTGTGGSVSYSIGQPFFTTSSSALGSTAAGVEQPYEISLLSGGKNAENVALMVSTYPNPTAGSLIVKINGLKINKLSYTLYDVNGRIISKQTIRSSETVLQLDPLPPATYVLSIVQGKKDVKTVKIIKK